MVLDSVYSQNGNSPVSADKPAAGRYTELLRLLDEVLLKSIAIASVADSRSLPFTKIFSIAEMIIYSVSKTEEIFVPVMNPSYVGNYIPGHSLNVAFLSCKVGIGMQLSFKELSELCVAALLHDIGMTRIAPDYYYHDRALTKREREIIETHPSVGHEFLSELLYEFPWLGRAVLEEHKREHNQGYPAAVQGELHLYSRIIGLCDSFEALTHHRHHRRASHPADAMKSILNTRGVYFAKDILRSMIECLSMYPVGSLVQLNNKKIAVVSEAVEGSPLRPRVSVIRDSDGRTIAENPETIDLSKEQTLYITGLVYDDNYEVPQRQN